MEKNKKILLGVAAAGVLAYLVYKKKYANFAVAKPPKKKSKFLEFWDKVFSARAGVWIKKK
jgi:uncharacterized membrane protein YebE (DUF533 family)